MTRPIRIGIQLHPQHAEYSDIRRAVLEAEDLGIDAVFNWDHFYPLYGEPDGKHFEAWTMLASWGEITERIEFGPLVTCNSYRNPQLLADMARTVDHISDGRLILGLGSGWFERDYTEFGYEFGTAPDRLRNLDRDLPLLRDRLTKLNPAPVRDIPILLGGGGEKVTLRITAEHANIWHGFGSPETLTHKNQVLDDWCAKVGRDPSEIERSASFKDVAGQTVESAEAMADAGINLFMMVADGPDYDMSQAAALTRWRDERNT